MPPASATGEYRVGVLVRRGRFTVVEPLFERGRRQPVERSGRGDSEIGDLVLVTTGRRDGRARIVRSLGRPDVPRNVIEALLADRGYERGFRRAVEDEATARARSDDRLTRRDLTGTATFTIDPASARDYDDAISAERHGDGLRVLVHIADVSAFVPAGSATDQEALRRGNSVYVPGTVEPMLPGVLSSEACSLFPDVPRRTVTAEMLLAGDGHVTRTSFYRSEIRSNARLTYEDVDRVFAGEGVAPPAVAEELALARSAAAELRRRRLERGALGVETSEPEFEFDSHGYVVAARDVVQTEAHGLIEELMILANERVAAKLQAARQPTLYRVHEQPDPVAIEYLVARLESLDVPTPPIPGRISPHEAGRLAGEIGKMLVEYMNATGRGREALTSLLLRSLKQAVYSPRNVGHAGLASPAYCHFTSPIRRYPDLCVHRALLAMLGEGEHPPKAHDLEEIAAHTTATEREAMALERDADDVCFAFLLERELGERGWDDVFEGEVAGVIGAGAFVSFAGVTGGARCQGFLPARRIGGDWYDLNDEQTALVGRRTGRRLRLGDPIDVVVRSVEAPRGRVDLEPAPAERAS
jgi:ribonuclease R